MKKILFATASFFGLVSTDRIMSAFTVAVEKLEDHSARQMDKAVKASDAAEAAYETATIRVEEMRDRAEAMYLEALAAADEAEEAEMAKVDAMDAKWAKHIEESNAARAASVRLQQVFGLTDADEDVRYFAV